MSICQSVRLSAKHVHCDKTKATSANILIPYERLINLVSSMTHKNGLYGRPLLPEILGQSDRIVQQNCNFQSIFAPSASAVRPSEKVQL